MTIKRTMRSLKDYSIYLLSKRDYGVKELERKLILKGYELDEIGNSVRKPDSLFIEARKK